MADPGPPRYIQVYQGRTSETVFSGYRLVKRDTRGLVANRLWSDREWRCWGPAEERDCGWVPVYKVGGPLTIPLDTYNAIRSNPIRNGDGSIVGYRISEELFATPEGMDFIGNSCGWGQCLVLRTSDLSEWEYNSTLSQPLNLPTAKAGGF